MRSAIFRQKGQRERSLDVEGSGTNCQPIPACDGQTDGQTDTPPMPTSRSNIAERDKNGKRSN